jgi:hypothetical protein
MEAASTLAVVENVKQVLPRIKQIVPAACNIEILVDQSVFVRDCVNDVIREAMHRSWLDSPDDVSSYWAAGAVLSLLPPVSPWP